MFGALCRLLLLTSIFGASAMQAQQPSAPAQQEPPPTPAPSAAEPRPPSPGPPSQIIVTTPTGTCIKPPPDVTWSDYQGPFAKVVGIFGSKLEIESAGTPHYKPGALLCTLTVKGKFLLFVKTSVAPATFLTAGFDAGISQAQNDDPSYGQGAAGYGKRFGASLAGQASGEFFKEFLYPTIFSEDPRYYRLGEGSFHKRFFHAVGHTVLAYREDGTTMFNFSEWLGTASAILLANTYHPDNRRGFGPAAERFGYSVGSDAGFDVLREFWPEVVRKFKLPFRDQSNP
jgi:hypothetical protein